MATSTATRQLASSVPFGYSLGGFLHTTQVPSSSQQQPQQRLDISNHPQAAASSSLTDAQMQASAGLPRSPYDYHSPPQYQSSLQTHPATAHQHMPTYSQGTSTAATSSYASQSAAGTADAYWAQEGSSEDDAYGGYDDYADAYMYDDDEPSPPAPVPPSTGGTSAYASPSSAPSKSSATSSSYQPYRDPAQSSSSSPTSPLQPPHPSLSPGYRSSAASSYSSGSSSSNKGQLGAGLALSQSDQRSTWRSDITNADAFAFREYESPAPPRVVITAPMTPPTKRMSEVEEEHWEDEMSRHYVTEEEEEVDMTVSPLMIREKELEPAHQQQQYKNIDDEPSMMNPSASGKSRSMYNAANFSRPIRGSSSGPVEPQSQAASSVAFPPYDDPAPTARGYADARPERESLASVYSTASTLPPISVRRSRAGSDAAQPLSILRTSAAYAESNRVLPPISPTSSTGSVPLPPAPPPASEQPPAQQVVNRKPSIRFQDPRPPPPVPPPVPPPALQRSVSVSNPGAPPAVPPSGHGFQRSATTTSPNRAQILEQARQRAPPPPPIQYNNTTNGGGLQPNNHPRSRSPAGDSVYSNYSYYDPEQVRSSGPSPAPSQTHAGGVPSMGASSRAPGSSPLAKSSNSAPGASSGGRSKSKHGNDGGGGVTTDPKTAEDYLQLGIQHHLDGDLVESAYCFEISAKGVGALRRANGQSIPRSSQSTSDHSHGHGHHSNNANGGAADSKYAVGGPEGG
ncbi:hypothetical protein FRB90_008232, partial [Tulasnella sp. 427]